jgi:aspartate/methionine/tyrosine aminotransferase
MFTSGTYESNLLVLSQAVEPGDEIVMMRPCWHQFAGYKMAEKNYSFCCGGLNPNSKVHLLTRKEEEDWSYDVDGLKEVASSKTGLIVVNSPDNPTGNITPPSELRAICEIAEDYGAYVLHDEIYRGTEWDEMFSSPQAVNYYDKAVATNSFSKLHGWDALRLGWLATKDKKLFSRCLAVNGWLLNGMGAISPLQLEVGLAGLERNKFNEHVAHGRSLGRACWDEMERWMSKLKGVFNWKRPMAGFLSFPSYNLEIDSWSFCERLAQEPYSTGIAPGMGYGFEKHLRLGIGTANPEVVKGGMEQVERFVSTLKPISDPITVRR